MWYTKPIRHHTAFTQGLIVDDKTGRNVAVSYDPNDAELIAAAPDLADAAELALRELREFYTDKQSEAIRILRQALNKSGRGG